MANLDLAKYGITGSKVIAHNPSYEVLFQEETKAGLEGFDKYCDGAALRWPEKIVLGADAADVKKNGLGIVKFPVYAEAGTYLFHATGSKVSIDGFVFSPTDVEMKVNKVGEEAAINNVKADAQNGAIFNVAGQKVGANYKGLVIKNGKKTIQ